MSTALHNRVPIVCGIGVPPMVTTGWNPVPQDEQRGHFIV
jgi:hypothetical protein